MPQCVEMGVLFGIESVPLKAPVLIWGRLDADLYALFNCYRYGRLAKDHCVLPEQDALSRGARFNQHSFSPPDGNHEPALHIPC